MMLFSKKNLSIIIYLLTNLLWCNLILEKKQYTRKNKPKCSIASAFKKRIIILK